jgi:hypothetical protein
MFVCRLKMVHNNKYTQLLKTYFPHFQSFSISFFRVDHLPKKMKLKAILRIIQPIGLRMRIRQTTSLFFFINKFAKPFNSSSERFFSNSFASAVSAAPLPFPQCLLFLALCLAGTLRHQGTKPWLYHL